MYDVLRNETLKAVPHLISSGGADRIDNQPRAFLLPKPLSLIPRLIAPPTLLSLLFRSELCSSSDGESPA